MKKIIPFISLPIILGGCSMSTNGNETEKKEEKEILGAGNVKLQAENFVRVQDYTGEGFALRNSERTKDIIVGKEREIEEAVVNFFQTKYKTEVKVHAIHPAVDGAAVYVESIGEPHFYTFAVVPIDVSKKMLKTDSVFTQEGKVESDIVTGMYAMLYEEEFANLDAYFEKLVTDHPVIGLPMEAVSKVKGNGYSNSYYFVDMTSNNSKEPFEAYIMNPAITKEEIQERFGDHFIPEEISIAINIYMSKEDVEPDQQLFNRIVSDIKSFDNIPPGSYVLDLHDNLINAKVANASKASSLLLTNEILKE